jgi:hypothetical protein
MNEHLRPGMPEAAPSPRTRCGAIRLGPQQGSVSGKPGER